jgi:hypothetical protein
MDTALVKHLEKIVLDRIASGAGVPVIDQLAAATGKSPRDLASFRDLSPAYSALAALKRKYIAQLAARVQAYPEHFPTLQSCAAYIVDRAETAEVEEELRKLSEPPDDGPKVA